jgi:hypothetical protein
MKFHPKSQSIRKALRQTVLKYSKLSSLDLLEISNVVSIMSKDHRMVPKTLSFSMKTCQTKNPRASLGLALTTNLLKRKKVAKSSHNILECNLNPIWIDLTYTRQVVQVTKTLSLCPNNRILDL